LGQPATIAFIAPRLALHASPAFRISSSKLIAAISVVISPARGSPGHSKRLGSMCGYKFRYSMTGGGVGGLEMAQPGKILKANGPQSANVLRCSMVQYVLQLLGIGGCDLLGLSQFGF